MHTKPAVAALVSAIAVALLSLGGCKEASAPQAQQAPEVGVVTLQAQPFALTTEVPGRTSAYRIAEVRPQVNGIIQKRLFTEGSEVKAGQQLYQIDPATYEAAFKSAQATQLSAKSLADRYKLLVNDKAVSQQAYDEARAASLQADAALEQARIDLRYTKVMAPIGGRIGRSAVTEGALVSNGQADAMAVIQQLDPIYVDVTESSNDFMRLKQESLQRGGDTKSVELVMENGQAYPLKGSLQFSDVTVDESTGSITLRAIFPNPQHILLPGMFVRARIDEGTDPQAILVPQQGVTRTPRGDASVMLVNDKNQVETRQVVASQAVGDKWLITSGLKPGDKVIISGLQKVRPGVTVKAEAEHAAPVAQ